MHACTLLFLDLSQIQDSLDQLASIYVFTFPLVPFITIIYLFIYLFFFSFHRASQNLIIVKCVSYLKICCRSTFKRQANIISFSCALLSDFQNASYLFNQLRPVLHNAPWSDSDQVHLRRFICEHCPSWHYSMTLYCFSYVFHYASVCSPCYNPCTSGLGCLCKTFWREVNSVRSYYGCSLSTLIFLYFG